MELSDTLLCLFSAQVEERRGSYVIELPESEFALGELQEGEVYRVAMVASATDDRPERSSKQARGVPEPPVEEGDTREVEIEDTGEQGDGIARVERGYIVFVPGTETGDRVTIEITDVRGNFAFGEVTATRDEEWA